MNKKEEIAERKLLWLENYGCAFKDIMQDEEGEYILQEPSLMDESEEEDGKMKKIYVPSDEELLENIDDILK